MSHGGMSHEPWGEPRAVRAVVAMSHAWPGGLPQLHMTCVRVGQGARQGPPADRVRRCEAALRPALVSSEGPRCATPGHGARAPPLPLPVARQPAADAAAAARPGRRAASRRGGELPNPVATQHQHQHARPASSMVEILSGSQMDTVMLSSPAVPSTSSTTGLAAVAGGGACSGGGAAQAIPRRGTRVRAQRAGKHLPCGCTAWMHCIPQQGQLGRRVPGSGLPHARAHKNGYSWNGWVHCQ